MSRRNRMSCRLPRLINAELLDELQAVAVGIEDVQQPHLVVDLEHGPDLDVVRAEPLGLALRVVDVDRRDAGLLRLTLCECDPHPAALELRPPALGVEVRLGEPELPGVEVPRRCEIP